MEREFEDMSVWVRMTEWKRRRSHWSLEVNKIAPIVRGKK